MKKPILVFFNNKYHLVPLWCLCESDPGAIYKMLSSLLVYLLKRTHYLLTVDNPLHDVTTIALPEVGVGLFTFRSVVSTSC